ncbi:MAG: hypothetical protein A3F46_03975 [Legionellales bacterium RIFCSPHIGHO2_12_FULL_42_9]|nr:MAG: hypothetical protein A3F46_03975 [Legionellales bacterium RIFCSPHIGHO2_12_FULL_42_9]
MPKFNIALVPIETHRDQFINYATDLSSIKAAEYLLGEGSIPHVSLCQFEAEETEIINVVQKMKALSLLPIQLTFSTQRCKTYPTHPLWGKWSWISLISDQLDQLKSLHLQVAQIVKPINASFDDYDPHMTLFNSCNKEQSSKLNQSPQLKAALTGEFEIILGELDDVGQVVTILYHL